MENITIIGNIAKCEKKTFSNVDFFEANVAVNTRTKNKETKTNWYQVIGRQVSLMPYLTKGKSVAVQGTPSYSAYVNAKGEAVPSVKIFVDKIELLGSKSSEQSDDKPAATVEQAAEMIKQNIPIATQEECDLPF